MKALVLISVLSLAGGIGLLFAYCHGTTGASVAYPLTATIHIDITATGIAALLSMVLIALGSAALLLAWFVALFSRSRRPVREESGPRRREGPFTE